MMRLHKTVLVIALSAAACGVRANGESASGGPPTTFERFSLSACTPCLRESYPVASLAVAPLSLRGFPRASTGAASRAGTIAFEVLRARQLGRPDWQSLALRVTLSVVTGPSGETFRLGVGLLDAADTPALAQAVAEMAKIAAAPPVGAGPETADIDFHGGSMRIGVSRVRSDLVAYVQAGDLATLMQRDAWEVPSTLFLPVADLPAVAAALRQAVATLEKVRGS
jgi:hypothetical protein